MFGWDGLNVGCVGIFYIGWWFLKIVVGCVECELCRVSIWDRVICFLLLGFLGCFGFLLDYLVGSNKWWVKSGFFCYCGLVVVIVLLCGWYCCIVWWLGKFWFFFLVFVCFGCIVGDSLNSRRVWLIVVFYI